MAWFFFLVLGGMVALIAVALGLQGVGPSEYRRRLNAQLGSTIGGSTVGFTGTTTTGSANVTAVTNISNLHIGMTVTGLDIPANTTILYIPSGTTIQLSNSAVTGHAANPMVATSAGSTPQVHLFADPFAGGMDPTPASFTEATFDTYTPLTPHGTGTYTLPNNTAENDFGDLAWILTTTPVTGNLIYGYWVDYIDPSDGVTRVVATWESFPNPIPMSANGNGVVISIPFTAPLPSSVSIP